MFRNTGIDWSATGSWAQFAAAVLAVIAAVILSRAELRAQRKVAEEAQLDYGRMIVGLCELAAGRIMEASLVLDWAAHFAPTFPLHRQFLIICANFYVHLSRHRGPRGRRIAKAPPRPTAPPRRRDATE